MIKSVSYNVSALHETNFTVYALINLSGSGSRNEPGWLQIDCNPFPFILFCSSPSAVTVFLCVSVYRSRLASISSSTALTRLDLTLQWPMMYREGSHWLNYKGRQRLRDEGNDEKTREAAATNYGGDGVPNTDRINPFVDLKEAQSEEFVVFTESATIKLNRAKIKKYRAALWCSGK